ITQVFECLLLRILHAERSRDKSVEMEFTGAIVVLDDLRTHQWKVVIVQEMGDPMTPVVVDLVVAALRSDDRGPHERGRKGRGQSCQEPCATTGGGHQRASIHAVPANVLFGASVWGEDQRLKRVIGCMRRRSERAAGPARVGGFAACVVALTLALAL